MIKIEITDIGCENPQDLLDLADYLQKAARNNQICFDEDKLETASNTEMPQDEPITEIDSIAHLQEDIYPPEHNSTQRVKMGSVLIEEEFIPVPPETVVIPIPEPSAVFAKCQEIPATPSVDLDAQGLPWDFRIHARTKSKNKDGSWKRLRGVSNNTAEKVETELKGVQNIPSAPVVPKPPEAPAMDFSAMMTLITTAITNKKIERHEVMKVLDAFGIPSIPVAATRPDLIPGIIVELQAVINESK